MKLADPHIDVASIYDEFHIPTGDFFSQRTDIPVTLPMLQQCEVDLVGFTLFMDPNLIQTTLFDGVMQYYKFYNQVLAQTDQLIQIKSSADLTAIPSDKIGFLYSIEGLECLRNEGDLDVFYDLGVRSFGLTWEDANPYATGNGAAQDLGITPRGKGLLKQMSQKNLIVDTAHLSDQSFSDLDKCFDGVIVNTHANVRAITNTQHNLTNDQIQIIVDHKGIIGVFPVADDVGGKGTFDDWYRHIDYIASKWGVEYVALCSDIFPLPQYPFVNNAQNMMVLKDFQAYLLEKVDVETVQQISHDNFHDLLARSL